MRRDPRLQYLKKRGQVWWLKLPIPRAIRHLYPTDGGKHRTHIEESLRTGDLAEASRAKQVPMARWAIEFDRAEREIKAASPGGDDSIRRWRQSIRDADRLPANDDAFSDHDMLVSLAVDEAERMEEVVGHRKAKQWFDLATSVDVPTLREAWKQWEAEAEFTEGTKGKYRHAFEQLLGYMEVADALPQDVTPRVARGFMQWLNAEAKTSTGKPLAYRTKKDRITALASFWSDYLEHHEYAPEGSNPWHGKRVLTGQRKAHQDDDSQKRAYTPEEMLSIINGPESERPTMTSYPKRTLLELYALGFYTGARLDEICSRKLKEIEPIPGGYLMRITRAKTEAGIRDIPVVHPVPVGILRRRIGDRTDLEAQLFAEFAPAGPDKKLSWHPQKALGRYRDKIGFGTATDFHSTRRNFVARMEALEVPGLSVMRYVGHKPKGVTFGTYSEGSPAALLKIAQAINYPKEIEEALQAALTE